MRELNTQEIAAVSGANLASIGGFLGKQAGNLANLLSSAVGLKIDFSGYAGQIGTGLGQLISFNFTDGKANIAKGYSGLINALTTALDNLLPD